MPYPNEHSARIKEPGQFDRFRRENDKFGPGIHAVWGIRTGQGIEIQAIRFDKTKFTVEEAKQWLKDHKISYIKFEPALNESEIGGSVNNVKSKIEHTGVLGMKWGRRTGGKGGTQTGKSKGKSDTSSAEHKTVKTLKKKKISEMSNDELKTVTTRLQLEQQYRSLNPSKVAKGKKVVGKLLGSVAEGVANQATQYAAKKIFDFALKTAKVAP